MLSQCRDVANIANTSVALPTVQVKPKEGVSSSTDLAHPLCIILLQFMIPVPAKRCNYNKISLAVNCDDKDLYPYLRTNSGKINMWLVSPQHGRSYVVGKHDNRYVVSKGNGLSFTNFNILQTKEQDFEIWGLLRLKDAVRDYNLGNEVSSLGITTNRMEAIIELDLPISTAKGAIMPVLLQYSVECPYRISDAAFMTKAQIVEYAATWKIKDKWNCKEKYKIAANILISNLRVLHDHQILHNALTSQNITWALELLDFELASSPKYPYDKADYRRHVPDLFNREILHIYQIIIDIAWILGEIPDYHYLDTLFKDYGFDFNKEFNMFSVWNL